MIESNDVSKITEDEEPAIYSRNVRHSTVHFLDRRHCRSSNSIVINVTMKEK